jgi:hypothetical protein
MLRLYKGRQLEGFKRMGIQRHTTEYNREYENETSIQLSGKDSHGKLVFKEGLEVIL